MGAGQPSDLQMAADHPEETLTDIQRAARFYYLQKQAFGGKVAEHSFGTSTTSPPRFNLLRIEEELSAAHLRLSRTVIEHMDWQQCIERYDRPHTLFYCDPPYLVRKAMVWIFLKGTTRGWQSWPGASEEK